RPARLALAFRRAIRGRDGGRNTTGHSQASVLMRPPRMTVAVCNSGARYFQRRLWLHLPVTHLDLYEQLSRLQNWQPTDRYCDGRSNSPATAGLVVSGSSISVYSLAPTASTETERAAS